MLGHRDIPLARAIVAAPWLGGLGCALPCFAFIGFWLFLCVGLVVGFSDFRIFGFSDCRMSGSRIALEMGFRSAEEALDHQDTKASQPMRRRQKIYTGRVKHKHGIWFLEKEEVFRQGLDGQMGGACR